MSTASAPACFACREHGIGAASQNLIDQRLRQKLRIAGDLVEESRKIQVDFGWLADTGTPPCGANTKAVRQLAPKKMILPHGGSEGEGERSRGEFIGTGAVTGFKLDEVNGALARLEQATAEPVSLKRQPMAFGILADDEVSFGRVVLSG